jgi:peptidyl-prolyl cis-trans isomerase B (cyclophilin B)
MCNILYAEANPSADRERGQQRPQERGGHHRDGRTNDPHSASSQFFINVSDNSFLDHPGQDGWGYCVFGRVTEGMDVVNAIKGSKTGGRQGHQDVPVEDVVIEKAEIVD